MAIVHRLPVPTDTPYRLGRHVGHDVRAAHFPFAQSRPVAEVTTTWSYTVPVLNQWQTSSCTGNAMAGFLNTDYCAPTRRAKNVSWLTEKDALQFYSVATHEENDPSDYYPPNDNGSCGLDVARAAQSLGWIDGYSHCTEFDAFRAALQSQPVLVGTVWTNAMFSPDSTGQVSPGPLDDSTIVGGHEYLALEIHYDTRLLWFLTSWGPDFGKGGKFAMSFDDFAGLLAVQGDVVVPHGVALP